MKKIQVVVVALAVCAIVAGYAELAEANLDDCASACRFPPNPTCYWFVDEGPPPVCTPFFVPDRQCYAPGFGNTTCSVYCGDAPC
jgi:hypothetical protein